MLPVAERGVAVTTGEFADREQADQGVDSVSHCQDTANLGLR